MFTQNPPFGAAIFKTQSNSKCKGRHRTSQSIRFIDFTTQFVYLPLTQLPYSYRCWYLTFVALSPAFTISTCHVDPLTRSSRSKSTDSSSNNIRNCHLNFWLAFRPGRVAKLLPRGNETTINTRYFKHCICRWTKLIQSFFWTSSSRKLSRMWELYVTCHASRTVRSSSRFIYLHLLPFTSIYLHLPSFAFIHLICIYLPSLTII